jgi:oligopeptide/dipeptide ABC transporter ATP-binding protein
MMFRGAMEGYRHRRGELLADIAASEHRGPGDLSFELGSPPDYMFISHDMRTMAHIADRVAVMYLGQIVEIGPARDVTLSPQHPYTNGLIASLPELHPRPGSRRKPAGGEVPNPASPPPGCRYHPRCPLAVQRCRLEAPLLERKSDGRWVACHMVPQ